MMTEEQIIARLQAVRLDRPRQPPPPPKPEAKAQERWAQPKPREAVAQHAAAGTKALAELMKQDRQQDSRDRRREQEAKEYAQWIAEGQNPRTAYQRQLDAWWQAKLDVEAEIRALHGEVPECGFYSPIARFEREVEEGR